MCLLPVVALLAALAWGCGAAPAWRFTPAAFEAATDWAHNASAAADATDVLLNILSGSGADASHVSWGGSISGASIPLWRVALGKVHESHPGFTFVLLADGRFNAKLDCPCAHTTEKTGDETDAFEALKQAANAYAGVQSAWHRWTYELVKLLHDTPQETAHIAECENYKEVVSLNFAEREAIETSVLRIAPTYRLAMCARAGYVIVRVG